MKTAIVIGATGLVGRQLLRQLLAGSDYGRIIVFGRRSAGITDALPLGRNRTWGARAKGVTYERGRGPLAFVRVVTA